MSLYRIFFCSVFICTALLSTPHPARAGAVGDTWDAAFNPEEFGSEDELKDILKRPDLKIHLPGVDFSTIEEV